MQDFDTLCVEGAVNECTLACYMCTCIGKAVDELRSCHLVSRRGRERMKISVGEERVERACVSVLGGHDIDH